MAKHRNYTELQNHKILNYWVKSDLLISRHIKLLNVKQKTKIITSA